MTYNKQELIKWMTEKRENLTFESKVQLIKDFWYEREEIGANSKEFKIVLEEWKHYHPVSLIHLSNTFKIIEQQKEKYQNEVTEKDNRNAQLHKLFQGTAKIFNQQHDYVDKLKKELEKESENKNLSQDEIKHLKKDVNLFRNWKDDLLKVINELEAAKKESEEIKDKEMNDLKENYNKSLRDIKT